MFKFEKDLVDSIVRNLNEVPDYKSITEFQRSSLLNPILDGVRAHPILDRGAKKPPGVNSAI